MSKIGSYAGVIFEVRHGKIQTFDQLARNGTGRWAAHDILSHQPKQEFLGPGLDEISFGMRLSAFNGINPRKVIEQLQRVRDTGKVAPLVIGSRPIKNCNWSLYSLNESHSTYDNAGNLISADVEIVLKEYPIVPPPERSVKQIKRPKVSPRKKSSQTGDIRIHVKSVNIRSGPSLNAKVVDWAMRNDKYKVYGTRTTDITWFKLGGGKYITANSKYVTFTRR